MKKTCTFLLAICFFVLFPLETYVYSDHISNDDNVQLIETQDITDFEYTLPADWETLSVLQRVEALTIPEETLVRMTDEALIQAIVEYPYLVDIYLYGSDVSDGIETASTYFSALNELISRDTAAASLSTFGAQLASSYQTITCATEEEQSHNLFVSNALSDIYGYVNEMNAYQTLSTSASPTYRMVGHGYIYTPNGSYVPMVLYTDLPPASAFDALDDEVIATYNVTLISSATRTYNCHSYAWNLPYTDTACWVNDPAKYMEDGSFTEVFTGSSTTGAYATGASVGNIIYYADNTHSAILTGNPSTGSPLVSLMCESKWGTAGVFAHALCDVPAAYTYSSVSIWE